MYREVRELFWNGQWKDVLCLVVTMIINIINKHKSLLYRQPLYQHQQFIIFCLYFFFFYIFKYLKQHLRKMINILCFMYK